MDFVCKSNEYITFKDEVLWETAIRSLSLSSKYKWVNVKSFKYLEFPIELINEVLELDFSWGRESWCCLDELLLFKNIKTLRLNAFVEIPKQRQNKNIFNQFKQLETLVMSDEFLFDGIFDSCDNLKNLHIYSRDVEKKANLVFDNESTIFRNCSTLEKLKIKGFNLDEVDEFLLKECINLKHLDLSQNDISYLPDDFLKNCVKLESLDLSYGTLEEIPKGFIDNNKKLQYLNLDNNYLEFLPDNLFTNCKGLKEIDLSNNCILELPKDLVKSCVELLVFKIDNCDLEMFPEKFFENCSKLKLFSAYDKYCSKYIRKF